MLAIQVNDELAGLLRLGGLVQSAIRVEPRRGEDLDRAVAETEEEMRSHHGRLSPAQIPGLHGARRLFRSIGVDPTRMRPASEALLRRVLKGQRIPAINSAVDAANLASLRFLTPIGLYDCDRIEGAVRLRLGREGESFQRIGKGVLNLKGRIGLFDEAGGFGNPTGDSRRTSVTERTGRLLFVSFHPADIDPGDIREMIKASGRILTRYTGGETLLLGGEGVVHA